MTNIDGVSMKRKYRNSFLSYLFSILGFGLLIVSIGDEIPGWAVAGLWISLVLQAYLATINLVNWRGWFGANFHES